MHGFPWIRVSSPRLTSISSHFKYLRSENISAVIRFLILLLLLLLQYEFSFLKKTGQKEKEGWKKKNKSIRRAISSPLLIYERYFIIQMKLVRFPLSNLSLPVN